MQQPAGSTHSGRTAALLPPDWLILCCTADQFRVAALLQMLHQSTVVYLKAFWLKICIYNHKLCPYVKHSWRLQGSCWQTAVRNNTFFTMFVLYFRSDCLTFFSNTTLNSIQVSWSVCVRFDHLLWLMKVVGISSWHELSEILVLEKLFH